MKILLTGILDSFVLDMIPQLQRGGHQLSLLSEWVPQHADHLQKVTNYPMSPSDESAPRVLEAVHFNAVIFFYSYQCMASLEDASIKGAMLDALISMQTAAQRTGVSNFVLVTDRRVFGAKQQGLELEQPIPDCAAGVLIKAAEDCFSHSMTGALKNLLVRVTSLVAPQWGGSFFAGAARCAAAGEPLAFPGKADSPCDFLRAQDLAEFMDLALESGLTGTAHVAYGASCTYADAARALVARFPALKISFANTETPTLQLGIARTLNWVPRHYWAQELDELASAVSTSTRNSGPASRVYAAIRRTFGRALPYVEVVLMAGVAYALTMITGRDAMFRYLNFWLLYVVIIGNMHGILPGVVSALIACCFYGADWVLKGNGLYLLLYNIDNWLPMTTYLLGGGIFGYLHDKRAESMHALESEKQEQTRETEFLETIYRRTAEDRARLETQVLRSRDSYGRIYNNTRQLDSLQPEQIFLSTLNVMENILQNQSVAIYHYKQDFSFARLIVHSSILERMDRSLDLMKLPALRQAISEGKVFANSELLPDYPSFAAPIMRDDEPIAMILLWDVPFEQCTLYFQNLFGIACGLAQSALIRALQYFNLSEDVYLAHTHLLNESAFCSALEVYRNMRRRHSSTFLLLRITSESRLSIEDYDRRIRGSTRDTDLAARLENGSYYVLLPQADEEHFATISARFASQQLRCELVPQESETLE
ncbi:MAG: hypothetical protein RSC91_06490 [Clostridia bacterium]